MIDRNALVSDLAKAYGVRVDVDDPILVAALLNRRLLEDAGEMAVPSARVMEVLTAPAALIVAVPAPMPPGLAALLVEPLMSTV